MIGYLKLIGYVFFIYICTYSIVNRICKCIEHRTEWKYRAGIDIEWAKAKLEASGVVTEDLGIR